MESLSIYFVVHSLLTIIIYKSQVTVITVDFRVINFIIILFNVILLLQNLTSCPLLVIY